MGIGMGARCHTRGDHYVRSLETKAGKVSLKAPQFRRQTFEPAIIQYYCRREPSAIR